ncbi:hypothetical protein HHL22_15400 [Hymenobacter sp. RP-2-7]|uniref:Uncharacterized protein n=1 Tax=Hymenobacter polaris TaxID=2682546 RepID=A0A7Y0AFV1_9BACT|nr:hypothetical protein [Hymenobacter polaris]NML66593.1 hypothetical protein [Hymenobacter polaris]
MAFHLKMAGSATHYDGVLSRPFLAEHWYRGFVAAATSLFILTLLVYTLTELSLEMAALVVAPFSVLLLVATTTQHYRFELDSSRKRFRSCLWVVGLRFGKWNPLPIITSVVIRHRPHKHSLPLEDNGSVRVGLVAVEDNWQVLLRVPGSPVGIVAAYVGQPQAVRSAAMLGAILQVEVETTADDNL